MKTNKEAKRPVHAGEPQISDHKIRKPINAISITIIILTLGLSVALIYFDIVHSSIAAIGGILLLILAASIRIADQWEKAVVLRMGKFHGLRGPGIFFIIPIVDWVDITSISACA